MPADPQKLAATGKRAAKGLEDLFTLLRWAGGDSNLWVETACAQWHPSQLQHLLQVLNRALALCGPATPDSPSGQVDSGVAPAVSLDDQDDLLAHILFGLAREHLLEGDFRAGTPSFLGRHGVHVPQDGIVFTPSAVGAELFLWARGHGRRPGHEFSATMLANDRFSQIHPIDIGETLLLNNNDLQPNETPTAAFRGGKLALSRVDGEGDDNN